jgi:hypothetical protein
VKKAQKERVEDDSRASGGRVTEPPGFSMMWLSKRVQKQNRTTLKVIWLLMSLSVAQRVTDPHLPHPCFNRSLA